MVVYAYLPRTTIKLVMMGCFFISTNTLLGSSKSWFSSYKHEQEELIELTPKKNPCSLCIKHELPGNISVKGWHQNHIAVTTHKKTHTADDAKRIQCTLTQNKNGTVLIEAKKNDELRKHGALDLTVHIPMRTATSIETLEDVFVENTQGTIRIQTETGTIATQATRGAVHTYVEKGDIIFNKAHGPIHAYTEKGSITIQESYNSIQAETDCGSINACCAEIPSTTSINLVTNKRGIVNISVPESTQARIVGDTTHGIITSNILVTLERHTTLLNSDTYKDAQRHISGIIGEQGNANIVINSARGIHISPRDMA